MKLKEGCGEVGSWPMLLVLPELREEGVGVWAHFQLGTESLPFFPGVILPVWPGVRPGAKTQQGKRKSPVTN